MFSISRKDYLKDAKDFIKISESLRDGWKLVEKDNEEGNAYLVFRQKINLNFSDNESYSDFDLEDSNLEAMHLDQSLSKQNEMIEELVDIEYHVVYSIPYQVPVLYFKGHRSNGKPLGLEDGWSIFTTRNVKSRKDMLSTLTQSDHPVLFTPFLGLHPCRTGELMSQMGVSQNIILTFLSLMGPYVRLNLKNEYGLAFKDPINKT